MPRVEARFPFGGRSDETAHANQPELTTRDAVNVVGYHDFADRRQGGQRSGLSPFLGDVDAVIDENGGSVQFGISVQKDLAAFNYTQRGNLLSGGTNPDIEEDWKHVSPDQRESWDVKVTSNGDSFFVSGDNVVVRRNSKGVEVYRVPLPVGAGQRVARSIEVDLDGNLYAGSTSADGSGNGGLVWKYTPTFGPNGREDGMVLAWEVRIEDASDVVALAYYGARLFVGYNTTDETSGVVVLDVLGGSEPVVSPPFGVPYPIGDLAASIRGVYGTCPPNPDRGPQAEELAGGFLEPEVDGTPHSFLNDAEDRIICWLDASEVGAFAEGSNVVEVMDRRLVEGELINDQTDRSWIRSPFYDTGAHGHPGHGNQPPRYSANAAGNQPGLVFNPTWGQVDVHSSWEWDNGSGLASRLSGDASIGDIYRNKLTAGDSLPGTRGFWPLTINHNFAITWLFRYNPGSSPMVFWHVGMADWEAPSAVNQQPGFNGLALVVNFDHLNFGTYGGGSPSATWADEPRLGAQPGGIALIRLSPSGYSVLNEGAVNAQALTRDTTANAPELNFALVSLVRTPGGDGFLRVNGQTVCTYTQHQLSSRALPVHELNDVPVTERAGSAGAPWTLTDATTPATFLTWGVQAGDEVFNNTDNSRATVLSVTSETVLETTAPSGGTLNTYAVNDDIDIKRAGFRVTYGQEYMGTRLWHERDDNHPFFLNNFDGFRGAFVEGISYFADVGASGGVHAGGFPPAFGGGAPGNEVEMMEGYMAHRRGLQVNCLPSTGHPYYASPPPPLSGAGGFTETVATETSRALTSPEGILFKLQPGLNGVQWAINGAGMGYAVAADDDGGVFTAGPQLVPEGFPQDEVGPQARILLKGIDRGLYLDWPEPASGSLELRAFPPNDSTFTIDDGNASETFEFHTIAASGTNTLIDTKGASVIGTGTAMTAGTAGNNVIAASNPFAATMVGDILTNETDGSSSIIVTYNAVNDVVTTTPVGGALNTHTSGDTFRVDTDSSATIIDRIVNAVALSTTIDVWAERESTQDGYPQKTLLLSRRAPDATARPIGLAGFTAAPDAEVVREGMTGPGVAPDRTWDRRNEWLTATPAASNLQNATMRMSVDESGSLYVPIAMGTKLNHVVKYTGNGEVATTGNREGHRIEKEVWTHKLGGSATAYDVHAVAVDPRVRNRFPASGPEYLWVASSNVDASGDSIAARETQTRLELIRSEQRNTQTNETKTLVVAGGSLFSVEAGGGSGLVSSGRNIFGAKSHWVTGFSLFQSVYLIDAGRYFLFDLQTNRLREWVPTGSGEMPEGARLGAAYRGRAVLARVNGDSHNLYASATGDPLDWNTDTQIPLFTRAFAGSEQSTARNPDTINAIIPYHDDVLIVGGDRTVAAFIGDLSELGSIKLLTSATGIAFGQSWAIDGEGYVYFYGSNGGVWQLIPPTEGRVTAPVEITDRHLNRELSSIDQRRYRPHMVWDQQTKRLHLYQVRRDVSVVPEVVRHWFWEKRTGAWWPVQIDDPGLQPYTAWTHDSSAPSDRVTVIGCEDGRLRWWDRNTAWDDTAKITSSVLIPIVLDDPNMEVKLTELEFTLAAYGDAQYEVFVSDNPEQLGPAVLTGRLKPGFSGSLRRRARGGTMWLRIFNSDLTGTWALESAYLNIEPAGRRRVRSMG